MIFIQFTGLSGAGKSTIAVSVKERLEREGRKVEIIDADIYRPLLSPDLGFSKHDRMENIRRLGFVAGLLAKNGVIAILAAINPYEDVRNELKLKEIKSKTVWINCCLETLIKRDTKGLYHKALLPDGHPDKIYNLSGVNDLYEQPLMPDLTINTHTEEIEDSVEKLMEFIKKEIPYTLRNS